MTPSDEPLCARCARHTTTCCQWSEVFVTTGDVARIVEQTGRGDFFEYRPVDNPIYGDQDDDPVWRDHVFRPDGTRRVVRHQPNGDCHFLGPVGCVLPAHARPLVCRLYPFDYTSEGIHEELAEGCPLELLRPGQELLPVLNMHRDEAEVWRRQLYAEMQCEPVDLPVVNPPAQSHAPAPTLSLRHEIQHV
jgi:Fe-S-cluster containining protein